MRGGLEQSLCGDDWTVMAEDGRSWSARVPGCAHTDLLRQGELAHPDVPGGEEGQSWVGRTALTWTRSFRIDPELAKHERIDLVFERLDTVAKVCIDGLLVLECANEFHPQRVNIAAALLAVPVSSEHVIAVTCRGAVTEVERLERDLGSRPVNGDWTPYPFIRKTACEFGWDWGPRVASSGIRGLVYLHGWSGARIVSVRPLVTACTADAAEVSVHADIEFARVAQPTEVRCQLIAPDSTAVRGAGRAGPVALRLEKPMRWWPRGYGGQPLYRVEVELVASGEVVDRTACTVGLRSVTIDTAKDEIGSRFRVLVNETPVWCAGANWIPDGLFDQCHDRARLSTRLHQACDANLVMLRVWGGGGYESDSFYDECDRLGLLVWQDFAFACATYPEEEPYRSRVETEARWQVARLSRHPSVVLWCGGNESILAWASWGFAQRLAPGQSWGRHYWLELLPRIVNELDPTRSYWTESPWSGALEIHPNDPTCGDRHTWDPEAKVEGMRSITPRFCSEFGHQSPPNMRSVSEAFGIAESALAALGVPEGLALLAPRQRATGGDEPQYGRFLRERFLPPADLGEWMAQAHIVQARAMRVAYAWMRANPRVCAGALVWQLNDAWTGHSWALVDVKGRPKPAWYAVRDACEARTLVIHPRNGAVVLDAINDTDSPWRGMARVTQETLGRGGAPTAVASESFAVEPRSVARVCVLEQALVHGRDAVVFAEAATGHSQTPLACAWYAHSHDRLRDPSQHTAPLAPHCNWIDAPTMRAPGQWSAVVEVEARSPLVDALVVPIGPWTACEPMLFSVGAHRRARVRLQWQRGRGLDPALGAEVYAEGRRVARLS